MLRQRSFVFKLGEFWHTRPLLLYRLILLPYELLYWVLQSIALTVSFLYQCLTLSKKLKLVVVTNAVTGGNGKTPTVIWLANTLASKGLSVAIIASGYKANIKCGHVLVTPDGEAEKFGDEAKMIAMKTGADVYVGKNKARLYTWLSCQEKYDICLTDDGFSKLFFMANAILWMSDERCSGNGLVVPFGPRRYPFWFEKFGLRVHKVFGPARAKQLAFSYGKAIVESTTGNSSMGDFRSFVCMTAIAKPKQVMESLSFISNISLQAYPDHYNFELPDQNGSAIIVTEKDWARLNFVARNDLFVLKVDYIASDELQNFAMHRF